MITATVVRFSSDLVVGSAALVAKQVLELRKGCADLVRRVGEMG